MSRYGNNSLFLQVSYGRNYNADDNFASSSRTQSSNYKYHQQTTFSQQKEVSVIRSSNTKTHYSAYDDQRRDKHIGSDAKRLI